ncbi:MAG TPA: branched-chain amino acid ABC transporter permease [Polyangiaceae bacterium]|nr:branched-chain amino acid ABC transporter permease [Polyangiaceae bacterium]
MRSWPRGARELSIWLLPVLGFVAFPDYLVLGSQIWIAGLFALSLDLCLGYAGIISLGHASFFGVGAYTAGLLAVHGWHEPLSALCAASLAAALVGLVTSFLVVDRQGLTRLMVTLGIGFSLYEAANRASSVTGGTDGLSSLELSPLLGVFRFELSGKTAYGYAAVVAVLSFLLVRRVASSPFGLVLLGLRENDARMPALGVPVRRRLIAAYTLAAALAGVAGALSAQTTGFVGLESLGFERSASVLIMLVLGGAGRLYGGFLGSAVFLCLRQLLSERSPAFWQFWLGALVVALAFASRGGLLGGLDALRLALRARGAARAGGPA